MRIINGKAYNFPLRQVETGYRALNSYRLTKDKRRLRRAETQARHLIATRVKLGDAWFYPSNFAYRFNRTRPEVLRPLWYQGLAQGLATGFFARLYETTGRQIYLDAARHTLKSFFVAQTPRRPWVSAVDDTGYLRIEEYPTSGWRFVFNGHMQAALGLWDYHRVTGDARALTLYRGALTAVVKYGEAFRTPGWISAYSLGARALFIHYHVGVGGRMLQLYQISGDRRFVRLVNQFHDDYPTPAVSGVMRVPAGGHTLRRFSPTGKVLGTRSVRLTRPTLLRVDRRARMSPGGGIWLRIAAGRLKGYSLRERPGRIVVRGPVDVISYGRAVSARLKSGTWTTHALDKAGRPARKRTRVVESATKVKVTRRAVVNGRLMVHLADDPRNVWLTAQAVALP